MLFLVTGGAGFLGSALANRLAAGGHQVRVLDDLSTGHRRYLDPAVEFTQGDVDDTRRLWSLLRGVDCVYHLAARVSVAQSILHPRDYTRTNVGGTVSLMEAMRDTGVGRVVFTSSGAVYGRQSQQPLRETTTPRPDTPYAVSKWSAEQYIHTIGELWGQETVSLRIFNAYGPRQSLPVSHAPVIPRFLQQVLTGGSVVVFGDGRQTRDFVYVEDAVEALLQAATAPEVNRRVLNIGTGVETSINTLVATMAGAAGRDVNPLHNNEKSGGVPRLVADITLARELLAYRPRFDLEQGLRHLLAEDARFRRSTG